MRPNHWHRSRTGRGASSALVACALLACCATNSVDEQSPAAQEAAEAELDVPFEYSLANPELLRQLLAAADDEMAKQIQAFAQAAAKSLREADAVGDLEQAARLRQLAEQELQVGLRAAKEARDRTHIVLKEMHAAEVRARGR